MMRIRTTWRRAVLWATYALLLVVALVVLRFAELSYHARLLATTPFIAVIAGVCVGIGALLGLRGRFRAAVPGHPVQVGRQTETPPARVERGPHSPLTLRELEVLSLLAAGLTNQQIADSLFVSSHTVKTHVANICRKLDVERRGQAVARGRTLQIIP